MGTKKKKATEAAASPAQEEVIKIPPTPPGGVVVPLAAKPYPTVATPDATFQSALEQAIAQVAPTGRLGPNPHVPISLIALATDGNHKYAGKFDDEMHYSASLLKVAAMYAAYELRTAARLHAKRNKAKLADAAAFFASLHQNFDQQIIAAALPDVKKASAELAAQLNHFGVGPTYDEIFTATGFGGPNDPDVKLSLNPDPIFVPHDCDNAQVKAPRGFQNNMFCMIVPSNNESAGECTRRLSYTYINAALTKAGFFDPATSTGIWLAGDYSGGAHPYARIDSVNDKLVGQATTTRQMSNFFALIELGQLINPESSSKMKLLLQNAQAEDKSWLDETRAGATVPRLFTVDMVKVGLGNLKSGPEVRSEGAVLKWKDTSALAAHKLTGSIAVCWQNLRGSNFNGVTELINKAYSKLLQ